jgi:hypothetical protein
VDLGGFLGTETVESHPWSRVGRDWRILVDFATWPVFTLIAKRVVTWEVKSNDAATGDAAREL